MEIFTFYDESYYERPACDCCEGYWVEVFNSSDTDQRLGSAFSIEDCYIQSIISYIGRCEISDEYKEQLRSMSLVALKIEAKLLDIDVEIVS